jgi:hypothetical protein
MWDCDPTAQPVSLLTLTRHQRRRWRRGRLAQVGISWGGLGPALDRLVPDVGDIVPDEGIASELDRTAWQIEVGSRAAGERGHSEGMSWAGGQGLERGKVAADWP